MVRVISLFFILNLPMFAWADAFVAGKDYRILDGYNKIETVGNSASVTEFFSYGCPWCYRLEPALQQWVSKQAENIYFNRVPVVFHMDWKYYAKAYYTINSLGLSPQVSRDLFKTILVDKKPMNSNQAMIDFFVQHGVENSLATSAFENSVSFDIQLKEDQGLLVRYKVRGVPSFVVGGEYITGLDMAKTEARLFEILDFLVNKAKKQAPQKLQSKVMP